MEKIICIGESYEELVEFYTNMSLDDFQNYVFEAYDNERNNNELSSNVVTLFCYRKLMCGMATTKIWDVKGKKQSAQNWRYG